MMAARTLIESGEVLIAGEARRSKASIGQVVRGRRLMT